jgi:DNA-directed RNA polymerase specialized sigma24 family protein
MDQLSQDDFLRLSNTIKNAPTKTIKLKKFGSEFVRKKVSYLPTGELAVVYLKFWEGYCEYEISKILSMSKSTVIKNLSSALERLKNEFAQAQFAESA